MCSEACRQHGLDMRRHVVGAFGVVGPSGILGREPIERRHQIVEHRRIGVFLNRQRRRGVADEQRHRAFLRAGILDKFRDLGGEIDKAGARTFATVSSDDTMVSALTVDGAVRENDLLGEIIRPRNRVDKGASRAVPTTCFAD